MPAKNGHQNGLATINGSTVPILPKVKEKVLQSNPVPEPALPIRIFRVVLLLIYFWTSSIFIGVTQYIGTPLYLINKDQYYRFMAFTKQCMMLLVLSMTQWWTTTTVYVSGDESVQDQIHRLPNGRLKCSFASRMVLISNHQLYNDWIYLWWTAYINRPFNHGHVYIVLKESIMYIPLVGLGLRLAGFVFMSRNLKTDTPRLTHRLSQLTRRSDGGKGELQPMWLMMFPEGTNLSKNGRAKSVKWAERQGEKDLKYTLIPRSTGTYFCLKALKGTLEWVYDCTLAYDGVPEGQYGQDVFTLRSTYFERHPQAPIHMHWRRFKVSDIPLETLEDFHAWLMERWNEKEALLKEHARTGHFPSSINQGKSITTELQLGRWWEILQTGAVLAPITIGIFAISSFVGHVRSG
ncbi:hypothetical protein IMSHALPRED_007850 [Imshaugia aleurites]|uniref:Phospholipid/glycerol acyltransferase domain-containing protein n=1 Tax=Imshaugia aleurites TaxID=172621 RepID=A0A8H3IQ30_9LECA|nr:hypothetical protein IMSHALPRED_007850 [Imshaugia aleurites]